jgi:ketosteroid isomerase-like protein
MPAATYAVFEPAAVYFDLVRGALGALVDGDHFFDGWPRVITGRSDLMAAFKGYVANIALQSADKLIVHKADDGRTVVIEYEVHGTILATHAKYDNRFCSIIRIENRKIAHWRDYMDSLAAWNALTSAR